MAKTAARQRAAAGGKPTQISTDAEAAQAGASHPPIYEPTTDPDTWQECLWSPSLNQYVCHDIAANLVPGHVRSRKYLRHTMRLATRPSRG